MAVIHHDENWETLRNAMVFHRQVTFHYTDSRKQKKYRAGFVTELSNTHVRILDRDKDAIKDCVLESITSDILYMYPRPLEKPQHRQQVLAGKRK